MNERTLGTSGLSTPPLVLGGNVFGWTADRAASFAVLDAFVAGGGRMIDTAESYSAWVPGHRGGESEAVIGEWLKARGRRDGVLIATKVGWEIGNARGLSRARIAEAIEGSLRRLGTDYIDLYFAHKDDPDTPLEETLDAFDRLVRAGKVRALGASNFDAPRLAHALDLSSQRQWTGYTVVQPLYNLMERAAFEGPLADICRVRNLGVLPYFGLASGFLTGKYRSDADLQGRTRAGAVKPYLNARGFRVLDALERVAREAGATMAQVALAWVAAQPGVTAPIASATSAAQVEELLGAMRLELTPAQLETLDLASRGA